MLPLHISGLVSACATVIEWLTTNPQGLGITTGQTLKGVATTTFIQSMFNQKTINTLAFTVYLTETNPVPKNPVQNGRSFPFFLLGATPFSALLVSRSYLLLVLVCYCQDQCVLSRV